LHLAGREEVEALSPETLRPFLSTRELFLLKLSSQAKKLRNQYKSGKLKTRRSVLEALKSIDMSNLESLSQPVDIQEIEWHISVRQLCQTLFKLGFHPSLMINSGLVKKGTWSKVAYKGGAEPGVLNYTHLVQVSHDASADQQNRSYCISATLNNPNKEVETQRFTVLISQLIAQLETETQQRD